MLTRVQQRKSLEKTQRGDASEGAWNGTCPRYRQLQHDRCCSERVCQPQSLARLRRAAVASAFYFSPSLKMCSAQPGHSIPPKNSVSRPRFSFLKPPRGRNISPVYIALRLLPLKTLLAVLQLEQLSAPSLLRATNPSDLCPCGLCQPPSGVCLPSLSLRLLRQF